MRDERSGLPSDSRAGRSAYRRNCEFRRIIEVWVLVASRIELNPVIVCTRI